MNDDIDLPFPSKIFANSPVAQMQENLQRALGLPAEFVASTILSAVSMAAGKGIEVVSTGGRTCRANLYVLVGASSGLGKSEMGKRVFAPHYAVANERLRSFLFDQKPKVSAKLRQAEAQLKRLDGNPNSSIAEFERLSKLQCELQSELEAPQTVVEDCTQEALEKAFSADGTVALISTDARSVSKNIFGRYRKGATEEDVFIKAWSGDKIIVMRVSRSLWIDDPCLAMFLSVQPDLFMEIFSRPGFLVSGFLPRILPVMVESVPGVFGMFGQLDQRVLDNYDQHLRGIFDTYRFRPNPVRVDLEERARFKLEVFKFEAERDGNRFPEISACTRRWVEQAFRVALCLHLAHYGGAAHQHVISEYHVDKAIEVVRWFGVQQQELLSASIQEGKGKLKMKIRDILSCNPTGSLTVRDLSRRVGCSASEIRRLVDEASDLELVKEPTQGRPRESVRMIDGV
ncbi:MAG: DUF3987 domain-containing protein [Verrucomicrobiales bacterium]|nr:DUF3987 domain-containing protein [Verrucomicrobiales bacterium]